MPRVTYHLPDGGSRSVEAAPGESEMIAAVGNAVPGGLFKCGGGLASAACHVFVPEPWRALAGAPQSMEDHMRDMTVTEHGPGSRLCCQIAMTEAPGGLQVRIAGEQA
ncbi:MAG: 2Fe-2S iron-sulfur cluster binding domain-containing protein [Rhodobacteraceae bacterium]|uniref:2Fe-2S iron-sulfur cluster-binding protein n=1 Tax=Salipiger thiooxidans TaxID=282683 RepID=UPI001A8E2BE3|nr:2Fe-2S iron-sulfur cluster-binding protein [Salipiger thiooxidans]MBN8186831.1 2Fe-2S iron-sulfur cluster binding domain-containing protein [Salipiger thiooxidans]MBR9840869.1 2Fe-2S iron-sulfur cluster binding domain-containing protein [Paracoccaceae bacterium]